MAVIRTSPKRSSTSIAPKSPCSPNPGPASAPEMRADLDRFRKELGTDQLDIVLMHCLTEGDWTTRYEPVMDVLSEAKQKASSAPTAALAIR